MNLIPSIKMMPYNLPVEETIFNFFPLLIVLFLAFVVPILLSRFRQIPVVVGEIVAGIIVGVSGFGWVQEDLILALISDIGLAFLMFLAGMEIDFGTLFSGRKKDNLLASSLYQYLLTLGLALCGALLLARLGMGGNFWLFTFILSATSLGVLMPVLKEKGLTNTRFGQSMFITASLADFLTVILLTVFLIIHSRGLHLEVFSIAWLFIFFFIAYRLGLRFTRISSVRTLVEELSHATVQLKVRGAITILLGFVVLANYVNAELILGAFLAGVVIALIKSPQDDRLVHNLEAFGFGFFIPVFFIMVGANLDLRSLWESPRALLFLPLIFVISLVIKIAPAFLNQPKFGWKQVISSGILLNTHLSLEIAVAVIGLRTGLISPAATTVITLFAILTVLIMPPVFSALSPAASKEKEKVIMICNAGPEGLNIARQLEMHNEKVYVFDDNPETVQKAKEAGFLATLAGSDEFSRLFEPEKVKAVLAMCTQDSSNLAISREAVAAGIQSVVAHVSNPTNLQEFRELGVQPYVPAMAGPTLLALMLRSPDIYQLLTSTSDDRDVREISLLNPVLFNLRLWELHLSGDILILAIRRNGEMIIPHGDVQLEASDRLTLIGETKDLEAAEKVLGAG